MRSNLHIAWHFIISRKRSMLLSLGGIVFGSGFFIITQAQTSGFEQFFINTILNTNGAIHIADRFQNIMHTLTTDAKNIHDFQVELREGKYIQGIEYPHTLRQSLEAFGGISGISEIVESTITASSGFHTDSAKAFGIRLEDHIMVANLPNQMVLGDLNEFQQSPNSVLIGSSLARRLQTSAGKTITLSHKNEEKDCRIAGIYETGLDDIDKQRIYLHIEEARSFLKKPFGESFFQLSLRHPDSAPAITAQIEASLKHHATSWQEREKVWLDVFKALRISAAITVLTIIIISGLGIFNTLVMLVMEKTKEIAILRSIGYTRKDITSIFLFQGGIIFTTGTVLAWIFAAVATYGISKIPLHIRGIFSTDSFIVNWSLTHYLLATFLSFIAVFIASYIPARRAANLEPAHIVRGAST